MCWLQKGCQKNLCVYYGLTSLLISDKFMVTLILGNIPIHLNDKTKFLSDNKIVRNSF